MKPCLWPDWLDEIWAKSADKGEGGQPEKLSQHTWSVLEKLSETVRLRPALPEKLGFGSLWHCLFWACFLHDFGKAAKGFQARLRGGERWPYRHEVLSLVFIDWISGAFSEEELRWVTAAIISHHKDAEEIQIAYSERGDPENQLLARLVDEVDADVLTGLWRWLVECSTSWMEHLNLEQVGVRIPDLIQQENPVRIIKDEGPVQIRKRLNEYQRWIRKIDRSEERTLSVGTIALRGHMISSDHMASAHVGDLPKPQLAEPEKLLKCWGMSENQLYAHQRKSMEAIGSAVLMAPTGSGKTEAALLWAVAQSSNSSVIPRLYYTLPYQASMNAMFDRLNNNQDGAFPGQVGLEHSRSTLAYYRRLLFEDESTSPKQAAKAAKWQKNLAKLNYFPVRVLSPYQILKSAYRLKGYETLLTDCFEATFILDEVHAYEAQRIALILGMVRYLREQFSAHFFVMSATLPKLLQKRIEEALGSYHLIQASPDLYSRFRRHSLILLGGDLLDETGIARIAKAGESGQSVLVCCNTVQRAQSAYQALKSRLQTSAQVVLLHGRFNGRDRLEKEKLIREATGSRSARRKAIVLVATQVVEVSLDIDLDVIYSDPAPLEALLQRFGRINRRLLRECAPVCVFRAPVPKTKRPYDPAFISAALEVLDENEGRLIDEARVSSWLDQVYQGEIAKAWEMEFQDAYNDFYYGPLTSLRAFNSDKTLEDEFYHAFDSVEVLPFSLSNEYWMVRDENPLEASQLFVPLRWGQFMGLMNQGRVRLSEDNHLKEVDASYDEEYGLDLNRRSSETIDEPI